MPKTPGKKRGFKLGNRSLNFWNSIMKNILLLKGLGLTSLRQGNRDNKWGNSEYPTHWELEVTTPTMRKERVCNKSYVGAEIKREHVQPGTKITFRRIPLKELREKFPGSSP